LLKRCGEREFTEMKAKPQIRIGFWVSLKVEREGGSKEE
jgi:hypothetical protein